MKHWGDLLFKNGISELAREERTQVKLWIDIDEWVAKLKERWHPKCGIQSVPPERRKDTTFAQQSATRQQEGAPAISFSEHDTFKSPYNAVTK